MVSARPSNHGATDVVARDGLAFRSAGGQEPRSAQSRCGSLGLWVAGLGARFLRGVRSRAWGVLLAALALPAGRLAAQVIPLAEALHPPTAAHVASIHAAAQRHGWQAQRAALLGIAMRAYESERPAAALAWIHLYRWATLLGQTEADFVPIWAQAIKDAGVGHANMATRYESPPGALAARLGLPLQAWLLNNPTFSAEFFGMSAPVDYAPRVLEILDELFGADPARFKTYARLALAIAVVYDVPPPPFWPHEQVSTAALPRRLPEPADAFTWWIQQEKRGRTFHPLTRLGAGELKFVVDATAPFAELEWAQSAAHVPLSQLAQVYGSVRYRNDRITHHQPIWPGASYRLAEILATGGICADQAYFAAQVGKARGVPTLFIFGPGSDGRHAWFGFLDGGLKWQLDAGRYAEQRFVTGLARDPQTWGLFSDHELQFLSEGFRALPSFASSRWHEIFAAEYLAMGNAPAAGKAARKAVNFERRNQKGWEILIAAGREEGRDARTIENLMREAALAFQRYPDLEANYGGRVAESLRARGERSAAEAEVRRIAVKNKTERGDLSVQQAREIVRRAISTQPLAAQIQAYNSVVDTYGAGAGMGFFDAVVAGFVQHLIESHQASEAARALERARRSLKVEPDTQLAAEFATLAQAVKTGK